MIINKYQTFSAFLLAMLWVTCLHAYEILIEEDPDLDVGQNTLSQNNLPQEGEALISWLGGAEKIKRILIGTPYINSSQVEFTGDYVLARFENSICVNSRKNAWHYAPFTMGIIYFSNGEKIYFEMYLSGISITGNLFAEE